jgi:hypothetical protein
MLVLPEDLVVMLAEFDEVPDRVFVVLAPEGDPNAHAAEGVCAYAVFPVGLDRG